MKKKIAIIILSILILITGSIAITFYHGKYVMPITFKTSFVEINDEQLPDSFVGYKILYFSDLQYGENFDKTRLEKLQTAINSLDYDLILFGGDLIDKDYSPVSDDVEILKDFFKSLKCKGGKFAILGGQDQITDSRNVLVKMILENSGVELISKDMNIYNDTSEYIIINGLNYGSEEIISSNENFTITLIHSNKQYDSLPKDIDLVLCGHTHDKQINLFSSANYKFGLQDNLYITRGIGLYEKDYRLFNYPELCLFTLQK